MPLDIGIAAAGRRTADLPLYTLRNTTTGETTQTTDPGRAMITGRWNDIGKFKGPILRALAVAPQETANDSILHAHLTGHRQRFRASRDQVREALEWLDRERLVTVDRVDADLLVATLIDAGDDVQAGRTRHRGVAAPSRG